MITTKKNYALCEREVDESHKCKKHRRDRDGNRKNWLVSLFIRAGRKGYEKV